MAMTREEVAQLLYEVGFRGEDLVSMVAIGGRESEYEPTAHRTNRDPSLMVGDFGLFQINYVNDTPALREAIGMTDRAQLLDPEMNARAAHFLYERSGLKPWTAGPEGWTAGGDPLYGTDVAAARAAAEHAAETGMLGQPFDFPDATDAPELGAQPVATGPSQAEQFVQLALAQAGDQYAFVDVSYDDPDPEAFDCSELVEWAAARAGVPNLGEATYVQYNQMKAAGTTMTVEEALHTRGALLFRFPGGEPTPDQDFRLEGYHVAISLGDGTTIEAMGTNYGVRVADADDRGWTHAATIAGMDYGPSTLVTEPPDASEPDPLAMAAALANSPDTDTDMLADHYELRYGLAPEDPDTDGDGITDGYELIVLHTDAGLADSDFDGIADGLELSLGLNPLVADNPDADAGLVVPDDLVGDSDGDGLSDWAESLAGTGRDDADSDDDGLLDGDELMLGSDPTGADV